MQEVAVLDWEGPESCFVNVIVNPHVIVYNLSGGTKLLRIYETAEVDFLMLWKGALFLETKLACQDYDSLDGYMSKSFSKHDIYVFIHSGF